MNLRKQGTGNLGATNTALILGKGYGFLVLVFDLAKGFFSVKLATFLFPQIALAGLIFGMASVFGHIFPFYLGFQGGKGMAAFAGMILSLDPVVFFILLTLCLILLFFVKYTVILPLTAVALAPFFMGLRTQSVTVFSAFLILGCLILYKHKDNLKRIRSGTESTFRSFFHHHS